MSTVSHTLADRYQAGKILLKTCMKKIRLEMTRIGSFH